MLFVAVTSKSFLSFYCLKKYLICPSMPFYGKALLTTKMNNSCNSLPNNWIFFTSLVNNSNCAHVKCEEGFQFYFWSPKPLVLHLRGMYYQHYAIQSIPRQQKILSFYAYPLLKIMCSKCSKSRLLFYDKQNWLIGNLILQCLLYPCKTFCRYFIWLLSGWKCLFSIKPFWWSDKFNAFWNDNIWPMSYTSDCVETSIFSSSVLLWRGSKTST